MTPRIDLPSTGQVVDRSPIVQRALARLDRAVTSEQVARALVEAGVSSTDASSGALVLLTDDRQELRVVYAAGRVTGSTNPERRLPLTSEHALRSRPSSSL